MKYENISFGLELPGPKIILAHFTVLYSNEFIKLLDIQFFIL